MLCSEITSPTCEAQSPQVKWNGFSDRKQRQNFQVQSQGQWRRVGCNYTQRKWAGTECQQSSSVKSQQNALVTESSRAFPSQGTSEWWRTDRKEQMQRLWGGAARLGRALHRQHLWVAPRHLPAPSSSALRLLRGSASPCSLSHFSAPK